MKIAITGGTGFVGRPEDREVPRDGRRRNGEARGDLAGPQLPFPDLLQDLPSGRIGEGPEHARGARHGV